MKAGHFFHHFRRVQCRLDNFVAGTVVRLSAQRSETETKTVPKLFRNRFVSVSLCGQFRRRQSTLVVWVYCVVLSCAVILYRVVTNLFSDFDKRGLLNRLTHFCSGR